MTDQESDELLRCLGSLLFEACLQSHSGTEENGGNEEESHSRLVYGESVPCCHVTSRSRRPLQNRFPQPEILAVTEH